MKHRSGKRALRCSGSGQGKLAGFCEHGDYFRVAQNSENSLTG